MPRTQIRAGVELEIPDRAEHREDIAGELARYDTHLRASARAIKWERLPVLQGIPAAGALILGEGIHSGPVSGYAWALRRIVIDGLATGATPDVMNLYRNAVTGTAPLWQFNGNNFGYTFGKLELVLMSGDELMAANVGTLAATGLIRISGELINIPAERLGELA